MKFIVDPAQREILPGDRVCIGENGKLRLAIPGDNNSFTLPPGSRQVGATMIIPYEIGDDVASALKSGPTIVYVGK